MLRKLDNKLLIKIVLILLCLLALTSFKAQQVAKREVKQKSSPNLQARSSRLEKDPPCLEMYEAIERYADSFDIPKRYAYGIAKAETNYCGPFDWNYDHRKTSSVGAVGPMQVMLATGKSINKSKESDGAVKARLKNDIYYNVKTSMNLLRRLYDKHHDWKLVFGAYNTGHPCVNGYALKVFNHKRSW